MSITKSVENFNVWGNYICQWLFISYVLQYDYISDGNDLSVQGLFQYKDVIFTGTENPLLMIRQ